MAEVQQKVIRCSKGLHFYDSYKYSECPYCNPGGFSETINIFEDTAAPQGGSSGFPPTQSVDGGSSMTSNVPPAGGSYIPGGSGAFPRTQSVDAGFVNSNSGSGNFDRTIDVHGQQHNSQMRPTEFADQFTAAGTPAPVVGWLIAVSGPCRGTDYRLHTGYNYIGREIGDVCIRGDFTISAEKDANVTYVPQTKRFYIAHELGKNVLLVNDMPVIGGGMELHNYDRITIGNTQLLFVGLCGEQFSWNG